jgi:hypothetical protein
MMRGMTIQAVVFDIGGVLEITPSLALTERWEARLVLGSGEINERMADVWQGGSVGAISEADVHRALAERFGLDEGQVEEFMGWIWREYLGAANTSLRLKWRNWCDEGNPDFSPLAEGLKISTRMSRLWRPGVSGRV